MATLYLAFCKVLIQIEPKPCYSKELLSVIDSSKLFKLNPASTPSSLDMLKNVESNISFFSTYVG